MLDHIKHSIVSLQIAKNMAHPVNGIYNGPTSVSPQTNHETPATTTPTSMASINIMKTTLGGEEEEDSVTDNCKLKEILLKCFLLFLLQSIEER